MSILNNLKDDRESGHVLVDSNFFTNQIPFSEITFNKTFQRFRMNIAYIFWPLLTRDKISGGGLVFA